MKKISLLLFVFCSIFAQDKDINSPQMSFALDVGNFAYSPMISTEIEYHFNTSMKHHFSITTGLEFYLNYISPSIGMNYSYGKKHQLLAGIRVMATHMYYMGDPFSGYEVKPDISPKLGYRYVFGKENPKAFIQAYVSPHVIGYYRSSTNFLRLELYSGLHLGFGFHL